MKLHSEKAAAHLVNYGIDLYNRHIFVRYYDDVLTEEYDEYLNYLEYQKQLQMVTKGQNDERGTWLGQVWWSSIVISRADHLKHSHTHCLSFYIRNLFIYLLGRLFDRVDLIKPVSNVRPSVRTYVRPSTKSFLDFNEI